VGVSAGQVLRQAARRWPDRVAVADAGEKGATCETFTYAEMDERARSCAARLQARGVGEGDRVALVVANGDGFVAAWFGIVYAGAAVVPVPVVSAAPELAYRLRHAGCEAIIHDAARAALVQEAFAELGHEVDQLEVNAATRIASDAIPYPVDSDPGAPATVLYTSGTTGVPRGALISHASLTTHTAALVHHTLDMRTDDTVLGVLPLAHSFGLRMVMLATFFAGARCVLVPRFDPMRTLALMEREEVSWLPAVPTMYAAWAEQGGGARSHKLRWALSAGAPLPDEVARRAELRLGVEIRQGYGMTEATFSTMNAPPDRRRFGSVGKPSWGVEVRIVDEAGDDVPQGGEGEVLVRGSNLMIGYLDDPEGTAMVMRDGWVRSGDVGRFDEDGGLWIVERLKDMIIRGGNNVYPAEVEDAFAEHPDIAEIAVIGRPDEYWGEEVVAVIVPREGARPNADELNGWARERVARTKVPREYAFVSQLPLGPSGKVLKRELRDWISQGVIHPASPRSERLRPPKEDR